MSAGRLHGMERCTVRTRLSRGHEFILSRSLIGHAHTIPFSAVQTLVDSALCAAISPLLPCEQIPQCDLAHSPRSLVGTYPYHSELLYSGVDSRGVDSGAPRRSTVGLKRYSGADALAAASGVTVAAKAAAVLTTSRLHSGQDGGGRDASLAVSSAVTHVTTRRCSHESMHFLWNSCPHGRLRSTSPGANASRQIAHSGSHSLHSSTSMPASLAGAPASSSSSEWLLESSEPAGDPVGLANLRVGSAASAISISFNLRVANCWEAAREARRAREMGDARAEAAMAAPVRRAALQGSRHHQGSPAL